MTAVAQAQHDRTAATRPATSALLALGAALAVALLALAGRYGYHRDELYFLRAGSEPAAGYVDQPPFTPIVAAAMDALAPGSLVALRLPSALAAGAVVVLTGLLAREFGGGRTAQLFAAACMAVSSVLLAVGHLLSTTTFDLLFWTLLSWLLVRAVRDGGRTWLLVGGVAGLALQNKLHPAFLLGAVVLGLLAVGPRRVLGSPWPWAGGLVALLVWAPNLVWQARNDWPQLALADAIAAGSSGTSEPWYLFVPFQLVLVGPLLFPVWMAGWWRLARDRQLRTWGCFAVAYAVLALLFLVTGGKPYYLAGLYPLLLAAGADPALRWARRFGARARTVLLSALALSLVVSAVLMLPVLPVRWLASTPVPAVNYDAGETVGWPRFAAAVEQAHGRLPDGDRAVVLTGNYGQAGAVDRYAPELGPAYSGHNSYWTWGPPPEEATAAVVVGLPREQLERWFGSVRAAGRIDNGVGLDNEEQGTTVWLATERQVPWSQIWSELRRLA
ncbi:glycosyltransferase family 39 protein [Blastococcus saxobsidens]|uniref:4-amino-4-deoxy-L-arabinose transferase-like glycosyltransferase n=1 Tax=Blastococcus saxobsidens TaxID=138336 RepID=A0A4Q7Y3Q4_9ACTN|nr:glycosyltransferase family 39 protein [Blastococcus saxobsidens]RZU30399.1 4-amino-4-deoxy-L-arabinose transferase-like glycosyltransferase [Blastococcus saxobsidens]